MQPFENNLQFSLPTNYRCLAWINIKTWHEGWRLVRDVIATRLFNDMPMQSWDSRKILDTLVQPCLWVGRRGWACMIVKKTPQMQMWPATFVHDCNYYVWHLSLLSPRSGHTGRTGDDIIAKISWIHWYPLRPMNMDHTSFSTVATIIEIVVYWRPLCQIWKLQVICGNYAV